MRVVPARACALAVAVVCAWTRAPGVDAHVQVFYAPQNLRVRNAPSATANGAFSTAGPCGGVNTWGANGFTFVRDGSKICGRFNYNGGHKDIANVVRFKFACGQPDAQSTVGQTQALPLEAGTDPAPSASSGTTVPAPTGNDITNGYLLCATLPSQALTAATSSEDPARKCTISLLDQRSWGGCYDVLLADADGALPGQTELVAATPDVSQALSSDATPPQLATTATGELLVAGDAGTYEIESECSTRQGQAPCCVQGYMAISEDGRFASGRIQGATIDQCGFTLSPKRDVQCSLSASPFDVDGETATCRFYLQAGGDIRGSYTTEQISTLWCATPAGTACGCTLCRPTPPSLLTSPRAT